LTITGPDPNVCSNGMTASIENPSERGSQTDLAVQPSMIG
jgi:hypothetical protein